MKSLTVRLPDSLAAQIEMESRKRKLSKSDIVRERLGQSGTAARRPDPLHAIRDLIGSVDGLSADLSARKTQQLKEARFGKKRPLLA
jgi:hypothetical protein